MSNGPQGWVLSIAILLLGISTSNSQARRTNENEVKSAVLLSPKFVLEPRSVVDKNYYNIDFRRGHIGLKSFNAEVVDEAGNPIPLYETYLHHWLVQRYYQLEGAEIAKKNREVGFRPPGVIMVHNSGLCDHVLIHYFGFGSETRRTAAYVPDPYGIEVGNPAEIPAGYEEGWLLNVHAIDTRGAQDRLGCTECRCDLYNVTEDGYGRPLGPDYIGGLRCCHDETHCRVREGFESARRSLYIRYTVEWVDWDQSVLPVKIYIFDVTDRWTKSDESTGLGTKHDCLVEYTVEPCATGVAKDGCIDTKRVSLGMPTGSGGDVVFGVAHQHTGGVGIALYGEDGRVICSSTPTYGDGKEAGNEAGYIVGMSSCYPQPGSVKISDEETLLLVSNYSATQRHTGVMGIFYILVAEPSQKPNSFLHAPVQMYGKMLVPNYVWGVVLFGVAIVISVVAHKRRNRKGHGYQSIVNL